MSVVAIFGAGELGGALASKLAARARIREIRLIDPAAGVAAGKALDILQAAPIEQSATRITAAAADDIADASVIVLADQIAAGGAPPVEIQGEAGLTLLRRLHERNARTPIVVAGAGSPAWLIAHACAELSIPASRIVGSAPYALASALRTLVALELNGSAQDISIALAGTPPAEVIVPWQAASMHGETLDRLLDHAALRRLDAKVRYLWPPGPYALAAAASRIAEALIFGSPRTFCGFIAATAGRRSGAGDGAPRAVALPLRLDPHSGARALDVPSLTAMQRSALALDLVLPR